MRHQYPQIEKLVAALNEYGIRFTILPDDDKLKNIFYRRIAINISGEVFPIPVLDEYEDVDLGNPLVLLHLVLQECEFYEEAEDFLVWTKDIGLNASSEIVREIHLELGQVVPHIRERLPRLRAISIYEMEFNTSLAQALRNTTT